MGLFFCIICQPETYTKKRPLKQSKMGTRIWKFQWWNWSKGPLICRNGEWFWFRSSVFQNQKGQGNCHQSEIIDRIQSEPKHNYWGARKNVQSVIFVPCCIFPFWLWHTDERNQNHSPLRQVVDPLSIPSRKFLNTHPIMCPKSDTSSNCNLVTGNLKYRFGNCHA